MMRTMRQTTPTFAAGAWTSLTTTYKRVEVPLGGVVVLTIPHDPIVVRYYVMVYRTVTAQFGILSATCSPLLDGCGLLVGWTMRVRIFTLLVLLLLPICYFILSVRSSLVGNGWGGSISSSSVVLATTKNSVQQHVVGELIPIYDLLPQNRTLPPHLTPIDPSTLISHEAVPIDTAHRGGKLHIGHVLFVMDDANNLLFLQRSKEVVTCPGTWSVLGEHANSNETPMQSVLRGIREELGFVRLLNYHVTDGMNGERRGSINNNDDDDKNIGDVDTSPTEEGVYYFRSSKDDADVESSTTSKNIIRARIRNITQYPLYYIRHYGPRNNNRIDSQLTYLWSVVVTTITTTTNNGDQDVDNTTTNDIQRLMHLDAEVADHKWMNLIEASVWLANDAAKMIMVDSNKNHNNNNNNNNNVNEEDDGPDMGDFCHSTIRSLYEVGLNSILQQMSN